MYAIHLNDSTCRSAPMHSAPITQIDGTMYLFNPTRTSQPHSPALSCNLYHSHGCLLILHFNSRGKTNNIVDKGNMIVSCQGNLQAYCATAYPARFAGFEVIWQSPTCHNNDVKALMVWTSWTHIQIIQAHSTMLQYLQQNLHLANKCSRYTRIMYQVVEMQIHIFQKKSFNGFNLDIHSSHQALRSCIL